MLEPAQRFFHVAIGLKQEMVEERAESLELAKPLGQGFVPF
jgi:hypothetical protein